jgi:hypothetical protein
MSKAANSFLAHTIAYVLLLALMAGVAHYLAEYGFGNQ